MCAAVTAQLSSLSSASRSCRTARAIACRRSDGFLTSAKIRSYVSCSKGLPFAFFISLTTRSPPAQIATSPLGLSPFQPQKIRLQPQLTNRGEAVHLFRFAHLQRAPSPSRDRHFQVWPGHIAQILGHQQKTFRGQRKLPAQRQLA